MSDPWQRQPITPCPVSVLLPAHDAAADLEDVVRAWANEMEAVGQPYELILVDDGSGDDTRTLAEGLAGQMPQLRVIAHEARRGFGAALRTGLEAASHPLLCVAPCDRQYDPADFKKLYAMIDQADLVAGLRQGGPIPLWLRAVNGVYRALARVLIGVSVPSTPCWHGWAWWRRRWVAGWILGVHLHDPESVFCLYRRSLFERLPIQTDGDLAQVEVIAKANFIGALMAEVQVSHRPLPSGAALHRDGRPGWRRGELARLLRDARFHMPPHPEPPPVLEPPPGEAQAPEAPAADTPAPAESSPP